MLLEGKKAVVTGIGPGMGRDITLGLAAEGADIMMVGRSDKHMPSVAAEVEALGRKVWQVQADVAVAEDRDRLVQVVADEIGSLDILINSAFHAGRIEPFETANLEKWRRPLDVNYFGT